MRNIFPDFWEAKPNQPPAIRCKNPQCKKMISLQGHAIDGLGHVTPPVGCKECGESQGDLRLINYSPNPEINWR